MPRWSWAEIASLYWPRPNALAQLANYTLRVAKPLFWHDSSRGWPKPLIGGTAFVLDFGNAIVGVTAAHVVAEFRRTKQEIPATVCRLCDTTLDLESSIVQCSSRKDITTFSLSRDHANALGDNRRAT